MRSAMQPLSSELLDTGDRLFVHAETEAELRAVVVARIRHGLIWVTGGDALGAPGERVTMERRIPGDATYRAPGRAEFAPPQTFALRRVGEWQRLQRRNDVRVATPGLTLELAEREAAPPLAKWAMGDLSCGGVSAWARSGSPELAVGRELWCRFSLPDAGAFALPARVVRIDPGLAGSGRRVAFRFLGVDSDVESELLRWVLRQQARQAR